MRATRAAVHRPCQIRVKRKIPEPTTPDPRLVLRVEFRRPRNHLQRVGALPINGRRPLGSASASITVFVLSVELWWCVRNSIRTSAYSWVTEIYHQYNSRWPWDKPAPKSPAALAVQDNAGLSGRQNIRRKIAALQACLLQGSSVARPAANWRGSTFGKFTRSTPVFTEQICINQPVRCR
jgi:hypothetical protein